MANLRRREDGAYPITVQQFKESYPNKSFGSIIDFDSFGYDVVFESPRPEVTQFDQLVEGVPVFSADSQVWMQTWSVEDLLEGKTTNELTAIMTAVLTAQAAALADYRYQVEVGGITRNGAFIPTTRDSQHNTAAALQGLTLTPSSTIEWSTPDGNFITVDLVAIQGLFTTVFNFVQACRAFEKSLYDQMAAITSPRELVAFNYAAQAWPT